MFCETYNELCRPLPMAREAAQPFAGPTPQKLREKLVTVIWADQMLDPKRLTAADGRLVKVVSPGWSNQAEGPDFRRAEIEIDGHLLKGDVEIHTYTSHWTQHGHGGDPEYDNVILHVVMWNDRTATTTRTYSGSAVPIVALAPALARPLEDLEQDAEQASHVDAEQTRATLSQERLGQLSGSDFGAFLDAAGDWRIVVKALRLQSAMKNDDPDEVFYRAFLESLGYTRNRAPFAHLAFSLPLESLEASLKNATTGDRREILFALFARTAGLLPESSDEYDEESAQFVERVRHLAALGPATGLLNRADWTRKGVRPASHPQRRIAAAANFMANCPDLRPLENFEQLLLLFSQSGSTKKSARKLLQAMIELAGGGPDHYFHYRYTVGSKRMETRRELIGRQLALTIVVNVVVPMLLALYRRRGDKSAESALHAFYAHLPKQQEDNITKFVKTRLLAANTQARLVNTARRQQALYQIYKDVVLSR